MNIRDHSSHFTIFIFSTDVDFGASTKVEIAQAGYDAYYFQEYETFLLRLKESSPHVLVFTTASIPGSLHDFVNAVHECSDEIKFIAVTPAGKSMDLAQHNSMGFEDVINIESGAIQTHALWSVDRVCEKLYYVYQNEQLYDDLKKAEEKLGTLSSSLTSVASKVEELKVPGPSIPMRLAEYRAASSKEDLIERFFSYLNGGLCIYFKFLPSLRSFLATQSYGISNSTVKGVGVQLDSEELKELSDKLLLGMLPSQFSNMLIEAFKFNPPKALPLYVHNQLEGVFAYSGSLSSVDIRLMSEEFTLMALCYSNFTLEKKVESLEVQDYVTELFNRTYYHKLIGEEVGRAARLQQPLSVIKIGIDKFGELESSMGEHGRDSMLKSIADIILKSSRTNDVTCRTALNEIAVILPHCAKKGAALRAERLRRAIEGTILVEKGINISVSFGVSEYPTLCESAQSIDETSTKALMHILDKGGNKICLYKAADDYSPEFEVKEM